MKSRIATPTKQMQQAVERYELKYRDMIMRRMIKIVLYALWLNGYGKIRLERVKEWLADVMAGLEGYGEDFEYKIDADFRRIGFQPFGDEEGRQE